MAGAGVVALIGAEGLTAIMLHVRANCTSVGNVILVKISSIEKILVTGI
jgi:hypothetical protein